MRSSKPRGRPPHPDVLTPAEWKVADFVRHGLTNRQIAARFGVSVDAVKYHVENIVAKLELKGRAELKLWRGVPQGSALRRRINTMETSGTFSTLGQISRSVRDIAASVDWFKNTLGLTHLYTFGKLAFFDLGGTRLFLEESEEPFHESVLYLKVPDLPIAYDELQRRGVAFTSAPHLIHRHADGMEEWMAFFDDLEGRPFGLMSQVKPDAPR